MKEAEDEKATSEEERADSCVIYIETSGVCTISRQVDLVRLPVWSLHTGLRNKCRTQRNGADKD